MDVNNGKDEVSVSSVIVNSIDSRQGDVLSPEDLAWADSCLTEDPYVLESTWDPLKNALLEIISSTPESFNTNGGADIEILPSIEESKNAEFSGTDNDFSSAINFIESTQADNMDYTLQSSSEENLMSVSDGNMQASNNTDVDHVSVSSSTYNALPISLATASSDNIPDNKKTETLPSPFFEGNPFLPTYSEDLKENESTDSGSDLELLAQDMEQPSDDIFKIWDLNIPTEDEFVKQLDKALATDSLPRTPPSYDDSKQWKILEQGFSPVSSKDAEPLNDLKEEPLENLIEGLADLSLNK